MAQSKINYSLIVFALAFSTQIIWTVIRGIDYPEVVYSYSTIITLFFGALLFTGGKYHWVNSGFRILLAFILLLSVGDRFGLLGPNGTAGVSWGDFDHFVSYTAQMDDYLPISWALPVAIIATVLEFVAGTALLIGIYVRLTELTVAGLLALFGVFLSISIGLESQFYYAVFVLASAAWFLSTTSSDGISVDILIREIEE